MEKEEPVIDFNESKNIYLETITETGRGLNSNYIELYNHNIKLIKGLNNICPYCDIPLVNVYTNNDIHWSRNKVVWDCQKCGYWELTDIYDCPELAVMDHTIMDGVIRQGIIKEFSIESNDVPLNTLIGELRKETNRIFDISPRKMEQVVSFVFKSYFNCEVEHCGRSYDGGIDLILINSDKPTMVQVKRRANHEYVEPVSLVREFLASILLKGGDRGIIVSTANKFSKESEKTVQLLIELGLCKQFELFNFDRFKNILEITKLKGVKPWEEYIR